MADIDINPGANDDPNPTDQGGGTASDWRSALGDELAGSPALQDIADVQTLAQNFVDQQAYLGNAIRPPGPEASEADRQAFYRKIQEHAPNLIPRPDPQDAEAQAALLDALGRPENADGYTPLEVDDFDADRFKAATPVFHELGLTQQQVEGIVRYDMETRAAAMADHTASIKAEQAELMREWGVTYEPRMAAIQNFAKQMEAPAELVEVLAAGQVNTETLKWLHNMAAAIGGEKVEIAQQQGGANDALTPAEAQSRANEITNRLADMMPSDPEYNGLVKKRIEYLEMAVPAERPGPFAA